jgi:outer membrane protein
MKNLTRLMIAAGIMSSVSLVSATNLSDVFQQAQTSDPTYKQAQATYLAAKTTIGQSRAALLPNLGLTGTWGSARTKTKTDTNFGGQGLLATTTTVPTNSTDLTLTLTQPLFDWQALKTYEQVKLSVKQAAATYADAEQTLIMSTAKAYFGVLQQQGVLRYTASQRTALKRQLDVAQQRYRVGLDAVTAVYDARAQYDSMRATYIATENELANSKESLRQITGQLYPSLMGLKTNFPLVRPTPANINQWTYAAEQQNLGLLASRYAVQAAQQNIKAKFGQHLPTLGFTGSIDQSNTKRTKFKSNQATDTSSYGLALTVPVFAGGGVNAQVNQAQYQYQGAVATMEAAHRAAIADTRQAYLGVIAEISQIQADRQAIKSARAALSSNQAGYKVGTQTILNVLTAQSTLYKAETTYAQDRFNYVINTLTLKQAVGTLSEADVTHVNEWLSNTAYRPVVKKVRVKKRKSATRKKVTAKRTTAKKA